MNASLNLLTFFFPPESLCFSSFRLKTDFKAAFFHSFGWGKAPVLLESRPHQRRVLLPIEKKCFIGR